MVESLKVKEELAIVRKKQQKRNGNHSISLRGRFKRSLGRTEVVQTGTIAEMSKEEED